MEKVTTLAELNNKLNELPGNKIKGIGHFNVFRMEDFISKKDRSIPYSRKDYYKISMVIGHNVFHYADKSIEVTGAAILLGNPMIPYSIERIGEEQSGTFCVFTEAFLNELPGVKEYPIFKPGTVPLYELTEADLPVFSELFSQMYREMNTDYAYKFDLLRALVLQVIHKAMQLKPQVSMSQSMHSANDRISSSFLELLERQFPIESIAQRMRLSAPNEFAHHLSVHINHLNRALKTITGKTTSQLIADRVLQEARVLLRHTDWNVAEIGYCLGYDEPSHFISFFRRNMATTPGQYRNSIQEAIV